MSLGRDGRSVRRDNGVRRATVVGGGSVYGVQRLVGVRKVVQFRAPGTTVADRFAKLVKLYGVCTAVGGTKQCTEGMQPVGVPRV